MPMTIKNDRADVLYHNNDTYEAATYTSPVLGESIYKIEFEFGKAEFREMHFDGIMLGFGNMHIHQRLHIESKDHLQRIGMHFMLKGEVTANINGVAGNIKTSSHQHNIYYNPDTEESLWIDRQPEMELFGLSFMSDKFVQIAANNGPVLDKMAEQVENRKPVFYPKGYHITPRMLQVIDEVRHCHFTGGLKKLFLQSKSIELLALQSEQIEIATRNSHEVNKLSRTDEERIYHARDLLLAHAQDPLSLMDLARKAGINEFKLKSGFRKVFDTTVFGYLSDHRLEQAKQMMREGIFSFTDIADELGYSSLQHFSNAFRKKFGVSPSELKKGM
ncbi:helix-turn-helix domain-containing protein [Chitinophaga sp. SYP-B3965]|uniref:helix-turn-helix transcriptional regulator n=1 Tax=Chitinophaga sp. SYP-B3965 TaxID=2663120 RepID=UPI001299D52E|nr:AraC family transcriptional regulator [Chitinophaga sp. SYP-B3965]MRG45578.1 helix-turn-helix domain-containing protein [Chitinophaga sp. SYP-B3965]